MRPLSRSRPLVIGIVVVTVAMGALGFVPLFDGPGYESALGAGLILPFAVAVAVAVDLATTSAAPPAPVDALCRGLVAGAVFAGAAYFTALVHGLRAGFCDVLAGSAHFALGPIAGASLAGAWGALAGEVARTRRRRRLAAVLLAVAGPLSSILVSVGRFYASPMVFAYDPFVGYFSGTLYDTVIDSSGLLSYRAGSLATLIAALALAHHLVRDERGRLRWVWHRRRELAVVGVLALVASVTVSAMGVRLGHFQSAGTIAEVLGARISGARCDVVYPRSLRRADMERFARDCDAHVAAAERWFGARGPERITAYVFESASQKGALMGASDTYVAKPWRREVYVQAASYPHPVIGHELIHVVAGAFGRGPFRVAGASFGLLPDPGLIEGVAVAAEPRSGDLLPSEWAKAMRDLRLLPRLHDLFALGFLAENSSVAYTVSGAFVGWVHDRWGAAAIRQWYGGRPLPAITGMSWEQMERVWHEELDRIALPDAARAQAEARFDRPAIFGRRCPHVVDGCKLRADRLRAAGDFIGAIGWYERVLELDPRDAGIRASIAGALIRDGQLEEGTRVLTELAEGAKAPRHVRDRALEELGDLSLAAGRGEEAARRYAEVRGRTLDEDHLRNLDVKTAAAHDERSRPAIVALLVGTPPRGPDRSLAMELLGRLAAGGPGDGLPSYLLARQYANAGQYQEAADRLDRALASKTELPRVLVEAERLRMVVACALGDPSGARSFLERYAAHVEVSEARREGARSLVERCTGEAIAPWSGR